MAEEAEEVFEAEVVDDLEGEGAGLQGPVRSIPERTPSRELDAWRGEVRTAMIAAAGGLAAGAAAVAAVNALRERAAEKPSNRSRLARKDKDDDGILASRSFLIDVHLLGR
ncbi:MAG: hypothetical protein ACR2K6_07790 [Solirubrobacterales bacterium]